MNVDRGAGFALLVVDLLSLVEGSGATCTRVLGDALHRHGIDAPPEEIRSVLGLPLRRAVAALFRTGARLDAEAQRQDRVHDEVAATLAHQLLGTVRELEGTARTLTTLRAQGLRIAIATSLPRRIALALLEQLGWISRGLVDTFVTSEDVEDPRPQPGMVVEAMRRTGVSDARRVLTAGATPACLAEGTLARCGAVVGMTTGVHGRDELHLRPHTHLVDRVSALPDLVALASLAATA